MHVCGGDMIFGGKAFLKGTSETIVLRSIHLV